MSSLSKNQTENARNQKIKRAIGLFTLSFLGMLLFAAVKLGPKILEMRAAQPVSFEKLMALSERDKATNDIIIKHVDSQPFGSTAAKLEILSRDGNPHAQTMVCYLYIQGIGVAQNQTLGYDYCKMAAKQGHPGAHFNLGLHYAADVYPPDYTSSIQHFTKAANHNFENFGPRPAANYYLSKLYGQKTMPHSDIVAAKDNLKIAADGGYGPAQMDLADAYLGNVRGYEADEDKAEHYLSMALENDEQFAAIELAYLYLKRAKNPEGFLKADRFARNKWSKRDGNMALYFARRYKNGLGVDTNLATAATFYKQAAEAGQSLAALELGNMYRNNPESFENYREEAIFWLLQAEAMGQSHARSLLVKMGYGEEENVPQFMKNEMVLLDQAKSGDENALYELEAIFYMQGFDPRFEPILEWIENRAEKNDLQAIQKLSNYYVSATGVERDIIQARHWAMKGAELNDVESQLFLAASYSSRDSLNWQESIRWYDIAARNGAKTAFIGLSSIYEHGLGVDKNNSAALYWLKTMPNMDAPIQKRINALSNTMTEEELTKANKLYTKCYKDNSLQCLNSYL